MSHNPDCDVNDFNLEGIKKPCNCGAASSPTAADLYEMFQIVDQWCLCKTCQRITPRTLDGNCWGCHKELFIKLGRPSCPPIPLEVV